MNTYPMSLTSVISRNDEPLTPEQLGYLEAYAQDQAHEMVLGLFTDLSDQEGISRAFLARRLDKKPEQITRWLAVPGNWTLRTLADLLGALGYVPTFGVKKIADLTHGNHYHPAIGHLIAHQASPGASAGESHRLPEPAV